MSSILEQASRRDGRNDADRGSRAGDDHEPGRQEGRERDGSDAVGDKRALAVPGRARADYDYGGKRVPGGVHGRDAGLSGWVPNSVTIISRCVRAVYYVSFHAIIRLSFHAEHQATEGAMPLPAHGNRSWITWRLGSHVPFLSTQSAGP